MLTKKKKIPHPTLTQLDTLLTQSQTNDIIGFIVIRQWTRDLVYLSTIYMINPPDFRPITSQRFWCYQKFRGQTEVGKIPQKNQKYGRTQKVNQLKSGKWWKRTKPNCLAVLKSLASMEKEERATFIYSFTQQVFLPSTIWVQTLYFCRWKQSVYIKERKVNKKGRQHSCMNIMLLKKVFRLYYQEI